MPPLWVRSRALARSHRLALCGLLALLTWGGRAGAGSGAPPAKTDLAPDFRLRGVHGEVVALQQLRGNILVMQFGTSW